MLHYVEKSETRGKISYISWKVRNAEAYDVVVEDIDMKAMSQCMYFGKSVMDNSYGKFRELLEYKLT